MKNKCNLAECIEKFETLVLCKISPLKNWKNTTTVFDNCHQKWEIVIDDVKWHGWIDRRSNSTHYAVGVNYFENVATWISCLSDKNHDEDCENLIKSLKQNINNVANSVNRAVKVL